MKDVLKLGLYTHFTEFTIHRKKLLPFNNEKIILCNIIIIAKSKYTPPNTIRNVYLCKLNFSKPMFSENRTDKLFHEFSIHEKVEIENA